ncbi:MAG TPA: hypothetical protein PLT27_13495, partial [Nitrospira sp.]|nr:hypothetical protein [Nitrospira sp.]
MFVRADQGENFRRVPSGQSLQFTAGQFFRIDPHAALRATIGKIRHGTLPRHPHRQRGHFAEIHVRMISDAAFAGASRRIV